MVTKQQIVNGLVNYVRNEVLIKIDEQITKLAVGGFVAALEINPNLLDNLFSHPVIAAVVVRDGDKYDLTNLFKIAEKTLGDYGSLPVTIPPIKYLSPNEKKLSFDADDIQKLKSYIES